VRVTKGLLTGKIKLADLLEAELIDEMETQEMVAMMIESGQDPNTDLIFDVDWVIKVELGSMAQADTEKEVQNLERWAAFRMQYAIPTDFKKISEEFATRIGIKEPEQYDIQQPQIDPMTGQPTMGQPMGGQGMPIPGSMPPQPMPM